MVFTPTSVIVEKWGPVIEQEFKNLTPAKHELMCRYADHHALSEAAINERYPDSAIASLLPMALKVLYRALEKIDLDETEVVIMNGPTGMYHDRLIEAKSLYVETTIDRDEIKDASKQFNLDLVNEIEFKLINQLADDVCMSLIDAKLFAPYIMVETIQTISEGTMNPRIAVKARYGLVKRDKPDGIDFRNRVFVEKLSGEINRYTKRGNTQVTTAFTDVLKSLDHLNATLERQGFYMETNMETNGIKVV